jgi:hypothetical protein
MSFSLRMRLPAGSPRCPQEPCFGRSPSQGPLCRN